jgi:fucose permease
VLAFSFAGFLLFGVLLVLVGASHADLAPALGLDLEETGRLGASLLLGMGIGILAAGPLIDRLPRRPIFLIAALTSAIALLTTSGEMGTSRTLAHLFFIGMGAGVFETVLNVVAVERYEEAAARYVTFLHTAATVGAMLAPVLLGALGSIGGFELGFRVVGFAMLALALWSWLAPFEAVPPQSTPKAEPSERSDSRRIAAPALLAFCAIGFSYIGVEASITLFAAPYADSLQLDPARGRAAISAFWFGLLLGRIALISTPLNLGTNLLIVSGVAGALLLVAGVAMQVTHVGVWAGACGLALSGVFPVMVALVGQTFPDARGSATGIAVGAGTFGGFAIPWLTGWFGELGGIGVAMGSLAVWCLAVTLAALAARALTATPRP